MSDTGAGAKTAIVNADETVLNAMRGYLRLSRNGGMPRALSDKIEAAVEDAARLQYFSVALAIDAQAKARSLPTADD